MAGLRGGLSMRVLQRTITLTLPLAGLAGNALSACSRSDGGGHAPGNAAVGAPVLKRHALP